MLKKILTGLIISLPAIAPAYVIKIPLLAGAGDFLFYICLLIWTVFFLLFVTDKNGRNDFLCYIKNIPRKNILLTSIFLISGFLAFLSGGKGKAELGQFIVLFFQPISVWLIAGWLFGENLKLKKYLIITLSFVCLVVGVTAILQYLGTLPLLEKFAGNSGEPKRAIGIFLHPNFLSLYITPLLALLLPWALMRFKAKQETDKLFFEFILISWIGGVLALIFSMSRSGWLGLVGTMCIYLFITQDKKIRKFALVGMLTAVLIFTFIPSLKNRFLSGFGQEKSSASRPVLWKSGIVAITQSPIFGLGLNGYAQKYTGLISDKTLDSHNFPHNIFLDLWVETGILGLISLMGLIGITIFHGLHRSPSFQGGTPPTSVVEGHGRDANIFNLSIALFLIAFLIQGQVDNPYFKNDLAMVFWIILALA